MPPLRAAARGALKWWRRRPLGPGPVPALAPFVGIAGDLFEAGAILVTAPLPVPCAALRFDDLLLLIEELDAEQILVPGGGARWPGCSVAPDRWRGSSWPAEPVCSAGRGTGSSQDR